MNEADTPGHATRKVVIAGASGLVGGHLLEGLLADPAVAEVHALLRRDLSLSHVKLRTYVVDFHDVPKLPPLDEAYLALGTTLKAAGSREAFRAVDFDANLAVAKAALDAGVRRIGLVSAMGADKDSPVFYNRIKGELEEALREFSTDATVIARPSLLLGDRKKLNQPSRFGEDLATIFMKFGQFLLPRNYRPVDAERVARALLSEVPRATGFRTIRSGELQSY